MRGKCINELIDYYGKTRHNFISKYYFNKEYKKDDLSLIDEIKEMVDSLEKVINEANELYNFLYFDIKDDDDINYLYGDGAVYFYNQYKYFISECRSSLEYYEEEIKSESGLEIEEFLDNLVGSVKMIFEYVDKRLSRNLEVSLDFALWKVFLENRYRNTGVIFSGDDCNLLLDDFVSYCPNENRVLYEVELVKDKPFNVDSFDFVIDNISDNDGKYQIIVIKNADDILTDKDLRRKFFTLLSAIYDIEEAILLLSCEDFYSLFKLMEIAGIEIEVSKDGYYYWY